MPEASYPRLVTDAELIEARLCVSDPRSEFDILEQIPPAAQMVGIVAGYSDQASKFRCARPGCGTLHHTGFVIQLDTGRFALIGHICGKQLFGLNWDEFEGNHRRRRHRQQLLKRRRSFLDVYDQVKVKLRAWRYRATSIHDARNSFLRLDQDLTAALRRRVTRGEVVLTVALKRDREIAEVMIAAQSSSGRRPHRNLEAQDEVIHVLRGSEFFGTTPIREKLEQALADLNESHGKLVAEDLTDTTMQRALAQAVSAVGTLRNFVQLHRAEGDALTPENLRGLAEWWNRLCGRSVARLSGKTLTVTRSGSLSSDFQIPVATTLDESPLRLLEIAMQ